jgi:hypothetical protein
LLVTFSKSAFAFFAPAMAVKASKKRVWKIIGNEESVSAVNTTPTKRNLEQSTEFQFVTMARWFWVWWSLLLGGGLFVARHALHVADEELLKQEIALSQLTKDIENHLETTQRNLSKQLESDSSSSTQIPWLQKVTTKIQCLKARKGFTFFYHTRKAGGTTIHDWLSDLSALWRVQYLELEGKSLNPKLLDVSGVFSLTALRDPIERIMSLYWYEHVAWWYDVKHEPHNCRTLAQWVSGWRDGSQWKTKFVSQNPGTVYVEVENYYVKSLIGWTGPEPIGKADLKRAKVILAEHFDFILLTEDMNKDKFGSFLILEMLFGGSTQALKEKSNKSDQSTRQRLESQLAADQVMCPLSCLSCSSLLEHCHRPPQGVEQI